LYKKAFERGLSSEARKQERCFLFQIRFLIDGLSGEEAKQMVIWKSDSFSALISMFHK